MKLEQLRAIATALALLLCVSAAEVGHTQVGRSETLVNPDMAIEKDLLALPHMNPALVKEVIARRPFLRMAELHGFLSDKLKKEQLVELYSKFIRPDQSQQRQ